jgi:signal transduction histidine kinase
MQVDDEEAQLRAAALKRMQSTLYASERAEQELAEIKEALEEQTRMYQAAKRAADERAHLLDGERVARAEIERVSLMKDELLATLSHALRTPLNAVLGWSEILLSRTKGQDSDMRRGLETIARNARAQAQLIEDLLDVNQILSGKTRLELQRVELASIVAAAVDSVSPSAQVKSIAVRTMIDPNAGPVLGDPKRLQQVVWNLLSNAVKFTAKGGSVDVTLQTTSPSIEIIVQDSGVGISPELLARLFARRADSSTTRKHGGVGLGLSIVKQLVELHGGRVEAASAGEGKGATFVVRLPLRAMRDPSAPEPEQLAAEQLPTERAPRSR